ncbi:MAG TPA: glycosyl transferase [Peptococcaceae bacterium]|nr:MAG: Glycosyl transferase family 2 [Clostridia bacterium 41_269]HBT20462.1 glycosyl transferase [Peptococcaceae bacterium]
MKISVIVPAYNEEKKIMDTVKALHKISNIKEIIVVDDGSKDQTALKAKEAGAKVVIPPKNLGKGGALNEGAKHVTGDIVVLADADLGNTAVEIEKLIEPILEGRADMSIAKIKATKGSGGFGLVKGLSRFCVRFLTGKELSAVLSGQRAMKREVFKKLLPFEPGFGVEVGMTVKALRMGCKIVEVPVKVKHRETGKNLKGFIHRGKQFSHILRVFLSLLVRGEKP